MGEPYREARRRSTVGPEQLPGRGRARFSPSALRRPVLVAALALVVGLVAGAFFLGGRGEEGAGPAPFVALTPAATSTVAPLPALPASCQLIAAGRAGDGPALVDVPVSIEFTAQPCAARTFEHTPLESLTATLLLELQAPDGPAEVSALLPATRSAGDLTWRGAVTYPLAGVWTSQVSLGALTLPLPPAEARVDFAFTPPNPAVPLGSIPQELTVLHVDRDGEPVRWEAAPNTGVAWIPGDVPGDPARAVWVQTRQGADWVVAGDPTDGAVTPLFEVEGAPQLIGAPDGRGLVVIDGESLPGALRLRVYNAEQKSLIEVPVGAGSHPVVAWSPDSSVILVGEERLHLLRSDGSAILVRDEVASSAQVEWAPDSKSALVSVSDRSRSQIIRVDVNTSTTSVAFEYGNGVERRGQRDLAVSPDGKWAAIGWLNAPDRTLRIAVLPADQPFATPLVDQAVVTYQLPQEPGRFEWIDTLAWSPDGRQLAFALGAIDPPPDATRSLTSLQVLEVQSGTVRELARPAQGYYSSGPLWWSTDGSAVFKQWFSCVQCDGGTSGIDVASVAGGRVVRTIEQGAWLGTLDGVRQLIATPRELVTVSGLEPPRPLVPEGEALRTSYTAAPSPDGNWLAVTEAPGAVDTVVAVVADGSGQELLGTAPRGPGIEALRDEQTVLTRDVSGMWAWLSLVDGATEPLPRPDGATPADKVTAALSADGGRLVYWAGTSTQGTLQLFVLDLDTGAARGLEVFTQESKGVHLALTSNGSHAAYLEGGDLVAVDLESGVTRRFALASMGYGAMVDHSIAFAWNEDGAEIDAIVAGKLWRADLVSGDVATLADQLPSPGGWRGDIVLSRSPEGRHLVAATSFGVFSLQADGSWKQVSAAIERGQGATARFVWSPDSSRFAYTGGESGGLVVAAVDGSGAYELVRADPARLMRVLRWLPDGRIVYALMARGI